MSGYLRKAHFDKMSVIATVSLSKWQ